MNVLIIMEEAHVHISVQIDLAPTDVPVIMGTLWLATNVAAMVRLSKII